MRLLWPGRGTIQTRKNWSALEGFDFQTLGFSQLPPLPKSAREKLHPIHAGTDAPSAARCVCKSLTSRKGMAEQVSAALFPEWEAGVRKPLVPASG